VERLGGRERHRLAPGRSVPTGGKRRRHVTSGAAAAAASGVNFFDNR